MNFGFQTRGGTAPALTSVRYGRTTRAGRPADPEPYACCDEVEDGEDPLGLPMAPAFRSQRQGKGVAGAVAKMAHGHHQPRPGWGKRQAEGRRLSDGMGPMLSTRPASRQALSDLMDLNLALKYDKMGIHGDARPQKDRPHPETGPTTSGGRRQGGHAVAPDSRSTSRRYSAPLVREVEQTSTGYSSPSERYNTKSETLYTSSVGLGEVERDQFDEVDIPMCPKHVAAENVDRWEENVRPVPSRVAAATALMISPSGCFEESSNKGTLGVRTSPVSPLVDQCKVAPRARRVAAAHPHFSSGSTSWGKAHGFFQKGVDRNVKHRAAYGDEDTMGKMGVSIEYRERQREEDNRSQCQETSSQQSEKDQRMWSALKTSLLSGSEIHIEPPFAGVRKGTVEDVCTPDGFGDPNGDVDVGVGGEARSCVFLKGTRDMEQLDLERSAMDRTMRPHRVASARLLETNQESSPTKAKHPRTFSASATRPRTRQGEAISSVWVGAGGTLQCTGVRAELVPRNGDDSSSFSNEAVDSDQAEGYSAFAGKVGVGRREGDQQLPRAADLGRFQWVTNDEGVATFLQRPPSRQKEAFPIHLADVTQHAAFQMELPMTDEEAKQHVDTTRKNPARVGQARPPSRHKPPGESLFLEVPETRRQVLPARSPSRGATAAGTKTCGGLPPGMLPMDGGDVEITNTRGGFGSVFALDRRHDNPDRDGFSVLQVQGPCPFRIEVTNSFVQPHPPTIPVDRDVALAASRSGKKTGKYCPPDPSFGLFGQITYDAGGRTGPGKQRAPTNTTPNIAVRSETVGKGNCTKAVRLLGNRCNGGSVLRGNSGSVACIARAADGDAGGDSLCPPPRPGNGGRDFEVEGRPGTVEGGTFNKLGEGTTDEGAEKKWNALEGGAPSAGRAETSGLRVNTGAPGVNVSDWSLQSCDDADDGAFLDGPASTLGESAGTAHTLLETTLGQDFLSLFAPSSGRDDSSSR